MRIGILVLAAGRSAGGIETYEVGIVRALAALDRVNQYTIYCPDSRARAAIGIEQENFTCHVLSPSSRLVSLTVTLPILLRMHKIEVFHATFAPPPLPPKNMVFTCHGLSSFLYPASFPTMTRVRLNWLHGIAIRRASRIICVSQHTAHQLQHDMDVSPDRLAVAPHGVGTEFHPSSRVEAQEAVRTKFKIDQPYILYMGKLQRLKNVARLVEAFRAFKQRSNLNIRLLLAGRVLQEPFALRNGAFADSIIRLGHVSPADVPDLYRGAEMLVFPSLFESFGMPAIEAMRCGTPVISSTAGAIPEICGDAAYLVNPYSVEDIANAMHAVYYDRQLRESLTERGLRHTERYSWRLAAEKTLDAYNQVFYEGLSKVPSEQPAH